MTLLDLDGLLCCTLPLAVSTGLAAHINGFFALGTNRVELIKGTKLQGNDHIRVRALIFDKLNANQIYVNSRLIGTFAF